MDVFDNKLSAIIEKVEHSTLADEERADIYARISAGLRHLVWPIIVSHIPEDDLKDVTDQDALSFERYMELIDKALKDPATPKEIHEELMGALGEVNELVSVNLSQAKISGA